jgi:hypothetical protein
MAKSLVEQLRQRQYLFPGIYFPAWSVKNWTQFAQGGSARARAVTVVLRLRAGGRMLIGLLLLT